MNSSDSAEEIVKISLDGMEVALKIAGTGAKNAIAMIYTIMKDKQQTKGKTRLSNMLKTGKALKIYTFRAEDLKKFSKEAKKYGVLYCVLANKKNQKLDGLVDVMVREEDASKVNRIAERFNFARIDTISIERELEKEKAKKEKTKSEEDKFIDEILEKPIEKEEQQEILENPSNTKKTEKENQSEHSLNTKQKDKKITKKGKKSVREEIKQIVNEIEERKSKQVNQEIRQNNKQNQKVTKHSKTYQDKRKGKRYKEPKHLETPKRKKNKVKQRERSK